mmetsp:Transcript_48904/g.122492  ORF Transcript_48904/g.122492 Transcript_48904/m.122492 type:complete len:133 (+) Transcript_48904:119-517(+)
MHQTCKRHASIASIDRQSVSHWKGGPLHSFVPPSLSPYLSRRRRRRRASQAHHTLAHILTSLTHSDVSLPPSFSPSRPIDLIYLHDPLTLPLTQNTLSFTRTSIALQKSKLPTNQIPTDILTHTMTMGGWMA